MNNQEKSHGGHCHMHAHEHCTLSDELICHFPYAVAGVAFSLIVVSFLTYLSATIHGDSSHMCDGAGILFHSFHFMHIAFAVTGTLVTYLRFSRNIIKALVVGTIVPSFFCVLSDAVLPYLGGRALGVAMEFHLCFVSELANVLPFLAVGLINGFVLSRHHASRQPVFSVYSHAIHIFVSSFASLFYLISHGCVCWYECIGFVFLFLIIAVVVPCTLSDVVVPLTFAKADKKYEKH
jgi:hypothetical protein